MTDTAELRRLASLPGVQQMVIPNTDVLRLLDRVERLEDVEAECSDLRRWRDHWSERSLELSDQRDTLRRLLDVAVSVIDDFPGWAADGNHHAAQWNADRREALATIRAETPTKSATGE